MESGYYLLATTYLMNEHKDDSAVSVSRPWQQRESIGMVKKHITESPINSGSRRQR